MMKHLPPLLLGALLPTLASAALQATFDANGPKSLVWNSIEFAYGVNREPKLSLNGSPVKWTGREGEAWVAPGVLVSTAYRVAGDKLSFDVTVKNTGAQPIEKLGFRAFSMQFPKKPKGWPWVANGGLTKENQGEPTILVADWGEGAVVACDEEIDRHCRFGWHTVHGAKVVARDVGFDTFPDLPIKPGESRTFAFSLRFGEKPDPANDIREKFVQAWPQTLDWPDRRPICAVFLANSGQGWAANPRGYFNDAKMDVATEAGKATLRERLMKLADTTIVRAKEVGAQGAIVWDIEGGEMPHAVTYLGDPRVLPQVAPEMDAVADEFFKKLRDAGLRVGVCIRPSSIVFKDPNDPSKYPWIKGRYGHTDSADPVAVLVEKVAYAKKRWGCSIFYMDTNYTPEFLNGQMVRKAGGGPETRMLRAGEIRELHRKHPDALIWPEFQSLGYFASASGYGEYHRIGDFSASVRATYPKAFRVWMPRLEADDIYEKWDEFLEKGVRAGEVFLYEGGGPMSQVLMNAYADVKETREAPKELSALLGLLKSETGWGMRRRVVAALGGLPDEAATVALAGALKSEKDGLEVFAGRSLGRQGTPSAMAALLAALPAPAAVQGLGVSGKPEAVAPLTALLAEKVNPKVRWAALDALAELRQVAAVPALLEFMKGLANSPAMKSREKVVAALGAIGDARAVPALVEALESKDYQLLRARIGDALMKITGFDGGPESAYDAKTWKKWQQANPR